jgi:hypothetical protein
MSEQPWPYNLPIWRRNHKATSPDGKLVARIDPVYEVSMGNPTLGTLCVSDGLHVDRCNPSFVWSDDSRFLAVPKYFLWFGIFTRQRIVVVDFIARRVYASRLMTWYFQPETFVGGTLVVSLNPFRSKRKAVFKIPSDLDKSFKIIHVPWPEMPQEGAN